MTQEELVKAEARDRIIKAAQVLCNATDEETWHGIISAAESAACLDAYRGEGIGLMAKLIDLAQAVQDYQS